MRRWQIFSVAVVLLIAASFVTGAHKAIGLAGVVGPWEPQSSIKVSKESCAGDAKAKCSSDPKSARTASGSCAPKAANPDPSMSAICERSCAARDYDETKVVGQPKAKPGDLTRCPVSGVVFEVQTKNASVPYAGKTWLTCCDGCAKKLAAAPERFLGSWISGGGQVF